MTQEHQEGIEDFAVINGFKLENADKLARVIHGDVGRMGVPEGGVGVEADPELVLARYDRLAGYITKDGVNIKTGSFWDFKAKAPRKTPTVMYIFNIGGDKVEVDDPTKLAAAISTVEKVRSEKEAKVAQKKKNSKLQKEPKQE
jgi:hypothetical protein